MVMTAIDDRDLGLEASHDEGGIYGIWYYLLLASGVVTNGRDFLGLLLLCTEYLQVQRTETITSVALFCLHFPLSIIVLTF